MDTRLGEIGIRAACATPAPLKVGIVAPKLDPVQWFKEHLEAANNPDGAIWVVWCPEHPDSQPDPEGRPTFAVLAAITGNGPTSKANAEFFAHARDDVPWLVDQVKSLQAEVERLRAGWLTLAAAPVQDGWVLVAPEFIREMVSDYNGLLQKGDRQVDEVNEGWCQPWKSRKWHYFRNGRSLCGKWGFPGRLTAGMDDSPDNCAVCKRKRLAELTATEAE